MEQTNLLPLQKEVPRVVSTDPPCIPLKGCYAESNVTFSVKELNTFNKFEGDMIIFCIPSESEGSEVSSSSSSSSSSSKTKLVSLAGETKIFDDETCEGALQDVILSLEFKAKLGRSVSSRLSKKMKVRIVSAVGLGNLSEIKTQHFVKIGSEFANLVKSNRPKSVAIVLHDTFTPRQVQCLTESFILEINPDNRFKSCEELCTKVPPLENVKLYSKNVKEMETAVCTARIMAKAIYYSMELVHAPANYCNTVSLANSAVEMAQSSGLTAKILEIDEIEKLKMGCFLGVAKGSMYPPKFIHLTYKPEGEIKCKIALVGKGLCFDSGGYNVKSMASSIELMKIDMGGAAAVFGAAKAIGSLKPKNVEVHFLVAGAENMISEKAYRPGDVLVASNGKTVEIGNTDAEGRLTLADTLVYAEKLGVDITIDVATLTGACVVALGDKYAGLFTTNDSLAQDLLACAEKTGESMWRLPVLTEYRELLDSKIADMNNIGGGKGGAILAAVFLKEFVDKMVWAHIDIAGPAWNSKEAKPTGFATRTLTEFVMKKSTS